MRKRVKILLPEELSAIELNESLEIYAFRPEEGGPSADYYNQLGREVIYV